MKKIKYSLISKLKLISSIMKKASFSSNSQIKFNNFRHKIIKKQLNPYFNIIYSKIKNIYIQNHDINDLKDNNIIWVFWWQGNDMPLVVKRCIESIKKNSANRKVILITKYNINEYSDIPDYIYTKMYNNKMSLTHFSDILRFNLLRNKGGLWIDSTVLCTSKLSNDYFKGIYTSGGYDNPNNYFISSKWTAFLIGGFKNNNIFIFMDEFFKFYWKYNDSLIDYFLVDYALNFVYIHNIGMFKYYVDNYAYKNNPHLHDLVKYLNYHYNKERYHSLIKDTNLFKLTYKQNFKINNNTFYAHIINGQLP